LTTSLQLGRAHRKKSRLYLTLSFDFAKKKRRLLGTWSKNLILISKPLLLDEDVALTMGVAEDDQLVDALNPMEAIISFISHGRILHKLIFV
jgi:hypothetical protein